MTRGSRSGPAATRDVVRVVLGDHAALVDLRAAAFQDDGHVLQWDDSYRPVRSAFAAMANEQSFDICEMAMATYIQARSAGKPLALLPVTVLSRFQHKLLQVSQSSAVEHPAELIGRKVGVRAYSQTTGLWVRAFLAGQFGVQSSDIEWVTFEGAHVGGATEPGNVHRARAGAGLQDEIAAESLVAGIVGTGPQDPKLRPLFSSPMSVAREWFARTGIVPVNHVVTVSLDRLERSSDFIRRFYEALVVEVTKDGGSQPQPEGSWERHVNMHPTGNDLSAIVRFAADECAAQGLTEGRVPDEDLFHPEVQSWI